MDEAAVVVLDVGAHTTKVGFSGDNLPRQVIQSVVAHHKSDHNSIKVGTEALTSRRTHKLNRPLSNTNLTNWNDLEELWRHSLEYELNVDPAHHPVLLTEHHGQHPRFREKKVEIFFESIGVPQFTLCCQSVLALYSKGKSSGSVLDIGDGHAVFLPVIDGRSLSDHTIKLPGMTGQDATFWVLNKLRPFGFRNTEVHNELSRHIKESSCRVSNEKYSIDSTTAETVKYQLPDDTVLSLEASKIYLDDNYFDCVPGVHMVINEVLQRFSDEDHLFDALSQNIVDSGGGVNLSGFRKRLQHEITQLGYHMVNTDNKSNPRFYSWIGGSILSSLSTFPALSVARQEYDEYGSSLVNNRCVSETHSDSLYGIYTFKGG